MFVLFDGNHQAANYFSMRMVISAMPVGGLIEKRLSIGVTGKNYCRIFLKIIVALMDLTIASSRSTATFVVCYVVIRGPTDIYPVFM